MHVPLINALSLDIEVLDFKMFFLPSVYFYTQQLLSRSLKIASFSLRFLATYTLQLHELFNKYVLLFESPFWKCLD